jgi:hypothetical protein
MSESHPRRGQAAVLDIGGSSGALVVYAPASTLDREIEICDPATPDVRTHNVVRAHKAGSHDVYAAVFPDVTEGDYSVVHFDGSLCPPIVVLGGAVTEVDLR